MTARTPRRLLALLAVVGFGLSACGIGDPSPQESTSAPSGSSGTTAPSDDASPEGPRPSPSTSDESGLSTLERYGRIAFLMPSQNVACLIEEKGVSCDIRNTSYQHTVVEAAADCVEPTVELYEEEPIWTCSRSSRFVDAQTDRLGGWVRRVPVGDLVTINGIKHTVLPYDRSLEAFDFRCESRDDGVRCTRLSDGRGFRMASQDYELY